MGFHEVGERNALILGIWPVDQGRREPVLSAGQPIFSSGHPGPEGRRREMEMVGGFRHGVQRGLSRIPGSMESAFA
jgi:hypothetical protein